jgi:PIN domain nuclease of toxin-antitoxin system
MANFLLHLFQDGGCDYTIGCGHSIETFEAYSEADIKEKVKGFIQNYGRDQISAVTLYEITNNHSQLNIDRLFAEDDAENEREKRERTELEERKILEELKNKYPDA